MASTGDLQAGGADGAPLWTGAAGIVLVAVCAILPFAGTRHHPHVHDDHETRGVGSLVQDDRADWLDLLGADWFGTPDQPRGHTGFWRPLVLLSFRLEARLAGDSWQGYLWLGHVGTILAHALASLALLRLGRALGLTGAQALVAAALFAVHPVHVESVAWTSGRVDSLAFGLAALGTAGWLEGRGAPPSLRAALPLWLAALLCKEIAVLWVGLAVVLGWARGLSVGRAALGPLLALALALALRLTLFGLPGHDPVAFTGPPEVAARWFTWLSILPDLVRFTLWPGPPAALHPVAPAHSALDGGVLAGVAVLVLLALGAATALRRRSAVGLLAAGSLLGTLVVLAPWVRIPLGFPEVAGPLAERHLYGAAAAPGLVLALVLGPLLALRRGLAPALALLGLVALGPITAARAEVWRDDEAFARAAVERAPGSARFWNQLGYARLMALRQGQAGAAAEARTAFERALSLDPDLHLAALNLFITLAVSGEADEARAAADDLLARWPEDPVVLDNVAAWHAAEGRPSAAAALYRRALATGNARPGTAEALAALQPAGN